MKRILIAAVVATFALGSAAMAQDPTCELKAVGKDGKPLAGAAKTSFMKKCNTESCEAKAVGSDGKKLAGAAKTSFMKKCATGA
jgi:opacity protein-like surface antigen